MSSGIIEKIYECKCYCIYCSSLPNTIVSCGHWTHKLLHSLNLAVIGLSVGYETWPPIGWHHPIVIVWPKYKLGLPSDPLHYWLMWPGGFPPFFRPQWQSLCSALMAGNCLPLGLCKGLWKSLLNLWQNLPHNVINSPCCRAFLYCQGHFVMKGAIFQGSKSHHKTLHHKGDILMEVVFTWSDWLTFGVNVFCLLTGIRIT